LANLVLDNTSADTTHLTLKNTSSIAWGISVTGGVMTISTDSAPRFILDAYNNKILTS
jgi:hypothetical protein